MRLSTVAPAMPSTLTLLCATPATDLRTYDVRSDVRFGTAQGAAAQAISAIFWAKRVRVTAPTTGMGHVGFAGFVPGSWTWSPPI